MEVDSMRPRNLVFRLGLLALVLCLTAVCGSLASPTPQATAADKTQLSALPAAKEELLGELSEEAKEVEDVVMGTDGLRFAARIKRGKQWVLVVDAKEGPAFDDITRISFSLPAGRHIVYAAKRNGKCSEMLDGKELGPAFDALVPDP